MDYDQGVVHRRRIISPPDSFFVNTGGTTPGGGGGGVLEFDALHKSSNISLTGSPALIATSNTGAWVNVRSTTSHSSGQYYVEFTCTADLGSGMEVGLVNASFPAGVDANYLGIDANSVGYNDSGAVYKSGIVMTTTNAFATGNNIAMAYDATTGEVWFSVNNSDWMGTDVRALAPVAGHGVATGFGGTAVYLAVAMVTSGDVWTINSSNTYTPPTGYGAW